MTLHLSECPEKAVQCTVKGCNAIIKRKNAHEHLLTAASTHAVLQAGEVQKLRGLMHFKVIYDTDFYNRKKKAVNIEEPQEQQSIVVTHHHGFKPVLTAVIVETEIDLTVQIHS